MKMYKASYKDTPNEWSVDITVLDVEKITSKSITLTDGSRLKHRSHNKKKGAGHIVFATTEDAKLFSQILIKRFKARFLRNVGIVDLVLKVLDDDGYQPSNDEMVWSINPGLPPSADIEVPEDVTWANYDSLYDMFQRR